MAALACSREPSITVPPPMKRREKRFKYICTNLGQAKPPLGVYTSESVAESSADAGQGAKTSAGDILA